MNAFFAPICIIMKKRVKCLVYCFIIKRDKLLGKMHEKAPSPMGKTCVYERLHKKSYIILLDFIRRICYIFLK